MSLKTSDVGVLMMAAVSVSSSKSVVGLGEFTPPYVIFIVFISI
jgi:hypothetical protein